MPKLATHLADIEPFYVMEVLARAQSLEAQGRSIVHMEIGEPDFPTADGIVQAGIAALRAGCTHYTPSLGLPALRAAVALSYAPAAAPGPERIVITPGASGALLLVFAALLDPGDQVLMTDPGYPCNRHFVRLFAGEPVSIPVDAACGYQLTAELVERYWSPRTVAVMLASPSNPTGMLISHDELVRIAEITRARGGVLIVDEIYRGLVYDTTAETALTLAGDVFVINSFSKYYGMTGWRVGWMVAPPAYLATIDKLAQNLFISTSTPAQYAALAAFEPQVQQELEARRREFQRRRDYLLPALRSLGFVIAAVPHGAFYL